MSNVAFAEWRPGEEALPEERFSAFMLDKFPLWNQEVMLNTGTDGPSEEVAERYEQAVNEALEEAGIDDAAIADLADDDKRRRRMLSGLIYVQKGLDAAHGFSKEYWRLRNPGPNMPSLVPTRRWIEELAAKEGISPDAVWPWTARYWGQGGYALTFFPGAAGEYEKMLFAGQEYIERTGHTLLTKAYPWIREALSQTRYVADAHSVLSSLRGITMLTNHMTKTMEDLRNGRPPGQFREEDTYLGPNDQDPYGYGSGAYSGVIPLVTIALLGDDAMRRRVQNPRVNQYYDPETRDLVTDLSPAEMPDLYTLAQESNLSPAVKRECAIGVIAALEQLLRFHSIHLAIIRSAAAENLAYTSPVQDASRPATNEQSMMGIIDRINSRIETIRNEYGISPDEQSRATKRYIFW